MYTLECRLSVEYGDGREHSAVELVSLVRAVQDRLRPKYSAKIDGRHLYFYFSSVPELSADLDRIKASIGG